MTRFRAALTADRKGEYSRTLFGTTTTWDASSQDASWCTDELHQGYPYVTDGPLSIDWFDRKGYRMVNGGPAAIGLATVVASNMCPDVVKSRANFGHLSVGLPSASLDAAKVLAYTNPNRGEADIGEDLLNPLGSPIRKIKGIGDDLIHNTADAHLWWAFGFEPFIDDLEKILDYQLLLQRRLREFESLFKNGGLRRKVQLGTYTNQVSEFRTLHSNVLPIQATVKATTVARRWGVVRWKPIGWHLSEYTDVDLEAKIRRLLYGLDLSPQTLWKLLPWTWLIGWFTNVNLLMRGAKANFPVLPGNVSICTSTETTFEVSNVQMNGSFTGASGTLVRRTKERQIVPSGGLPISFMPASSFGAGKSSILGSLFVQRFL